MANPRLGKAPDQGKAVKVRGANHFSGAALLFFLFLLLTKMLVVGDQSFMVAINSSHEPAPGRAGAATFEEKVGAIFVRGLVALTRPMVVSADIFDRDLMVIHQRRGELGGALHCFDLVVPVVFAHLDADGVAVAGAVEIGVFAALIGRYVLDDRIFLDSEMPAEVADHAASQSPSVERFGVGVGVTGGVLSAVNRDEARLHPAKDAAAILALGNEIDLQVQLLVRLVRADGRFSHGSKFPFPNGRLRRRRSGSTTGEDGECCRHHRHRYHQSKPIHCS